ncbi:MAG: Spy/CpxP family protein refolding chaperone [Candidatus Methylomirabilales bacterium]
MKGTMVALGLVGALALTATAAFAWESWRGVGPFGYGPGNGLDLASTNLSADQTAKIQKIQRDQFAEMAKLRTEMFTKAGELQALFREPTLDKAKIATKQKETTGLQAQMQEKALAAWTAVAEVLTSEQRAQLPASGPGMGPGFGPGFGPGRGFGSGMGMGPMGMGPRMGFGPRW